MPIPILIAGGAVGTKALVAAGAVGAIAGTASKIASGASSVINGVGSVIGGITGIFGSSNSSLNSAQNVADRERQAAWNKQQADAAKTQGNQVGTSYGRGNGELPNSQPILFNDSKGYYYAYTPIEMGRPETDVQTLVTGETPVETAPNTSNNKTKMATASALSSINPLVLVGGAIALASAIYYFIIKK